MDKFTTRCFHDEFYQDSMIAIRFSVLEDVNLKGEHDHTPVFSFDIYNEENENRIITTLQSEHLSGRVNFMVEQGII